MNTELIARTRGNIVPLVTPFTSDLEVDERRLNELVEFVVGEGAEALVACDAMGEFFSLTPHERLRVIKTVVDCAHGRALVIGHIGASSQRTAQSMARVAVEHGVDVLKLTLPYFFQPPDTVVPALAREVVDGAPYMLEESGRVQLSFDVIEELLADGNLIGVETWGSDIGRLDEWWDRFSDRLAVIPSGDVAVFFLLLKGCPGVIQGVSNFYPTLIRELLDRAADQDTSGMLDLFGRLRRHRQLFGDGATIGMPSYATYTKAALEMVGMPAGPVRPPLVALDARQRAALRDTLSLEFKLPV